MTLVFADESLRSNYIVCAAVVPTSGDAEALRKLLRGLRKSGQRSIHAKHESDSRRRHVLSEIVNSGLATAWIYKAPRPVLTARTTCLELLAADLVEHRAHKLVLDRGEPRQNQRDRATLQQTLFKLGGTTKYDHMESAHDPCLWAADVIAWAYGAGGDWQRRVKPIVTAVRQA